MPTVLVADDDAEFRRFLRITLEAGGFAVEEARDGAEALRLAARHRPALLLMDFDLGVPPDGGEVAAQLKRRPDLSQVPVVFLTGSAWAPAEQARAVLHKPVDPDDLLGVVRGLLEPPVS